MTRVDDLASLTAGAGSGSPGPDALLRRRREETMTARTQELAAGQLRKGTVSLCFANLAP
jgi:hypothetical protein